MYRTILNSKKILLLTGFLLFLFLIVSAGNVSATNPDNNTTNLTDD